MILVTGANGLIGQALVNRPGFYGIDIKPSIEPNNVLVEDFRFHPIPDCVTAVYHLAGLSRVCQVDENLKLANNLADSLDDLLQRSGPNRLFVLASSKEVLGDIKDASINSPLAPKSNYAELKAKQESIVERYIAQGWNIKTVRFSTVYGDIHRDYQDRVIPQFVMNAIHNQPLIVNGPDKTLEPTHLGGVINFLLGMNHSSDALTLLGSGQPITLGELALLIIELTNSSSQVVFNQASRKHGNFSSRTVRPEFDLRSQLKEEIDKLAWKFR
jgi:nucleoside-diphosphate-sugar epimerase